MSMSIGSVATIDTELDAYYRNRNAHMHNHPKEARRYAREYNGIHPEVRKRKSAKRRALGYIELNSPFSGCEGHHINQSDVIYIPKAMHKSVWHNQWTGVGMAEINALAGRYLTEDWT